MEKRAWIVAPAFVLVLAVAVAGCGRGGESTVKIGLLSPITTDAAIMGIDIKNAATLAVEDFNAAGGVNGKKIEIVFADTKDSDSAGVNAYNKVMDSKPVALVGSIFSTQNFAMAPLIEKAKIPTLVGATNPRLTREVSKWFIRVRPDDSIGAAVSTKFAVEQLKAKKIGVLYNDEQFGAGGRDVIIKTLKGLNMEPVALVANSPNDKDVSGQLLTLQRAGAEVIIAWEGPPQTAIVVKQYAQLGIKAAYINSPAIGLPSVHKLLSDEELDGKYGVVEPNPGQSADPKTQDYVKRFKEKYKEEPNAYGAEYYDATILLLNTIKSVGTDPEAIIKAVKATKDYKGIVNTYTSDKYGNLVHNMLVVKFNKKVPEVIGRVEISPEF
jgi:branched-chain amino acid transport system substrate-binding protein